MFLDNLSEKMCVRRPNGPSFAKGHSNGATTTGWRFVLEQTSEPKGLKNMGKF